MFRGKIGTKYTISFSLSLRAVWIEPNIDIEVLIYIENFQFYITQLLHGVASAQS